MVEHLPPSVAKCPDCGSIAKRCKRPSEHDAHKWHNSRENLYASMHPDCVACQQWLKEGHK